MLETLRRLLPKMEARYSRIVLRLILPILGPVATTWYFAYSPLLRRTEARLHWLLRKINERYGGDAARRAGIHYLRLSLRPQHFRSVLCLPGPWQPTDAELNAALPELVATAKRPDARSALAVALLQRNKTTAALYLIREMLESNQPKRLPAELMAVFLWPLAGDLDDTALIPLLDGLIPPPSHNRLIVFDGNLSASAISHLAQGAERLTVLRASDLYGRLDLDAICAELPGVEVNLEHARTRTGRFSRRYHDLHVKTLDSATKLVTAFCDKAAWLSELVVVDKDVRQVLVVEVADRLFFKALRLEGILQAVKDPQFDSVIISFGDNFDIYRTIFSSSELLTDDRIRACSLSTNRSAQIKFLTRLNDMRRRAAEGTVSPLFTQIERWRKEEPGNFTKMISALKKMGSWAPRYGDALLPGRQRVAVVTNEGRAYGYNAAQIAVSLHGQFDVDVIWTQGQHTTLRTNITRAVAELTSDRHPKKANKPGLVDVKLGKISRATNNQFVKEFLLQVGDAAREIMAAASNDRAFACAMDSELSESLGTSVLQALANLMRGVSVVRNNGYSAVALCPGRSPRNLAFVAAARQGGVPSITVEPHCINAAYCRYGAVISDFAAVYSGYFAREYMRHFSIPMDRIYSIGSPRILRPQDYNPEAERQAAREYLGINPNDPPIFAMPSQPMNRDHTETVWRMIVRTATSLGRPVRLMLKPHPEENQGDIALYQRIIQEEKAETVASVVDMDVSRLMIASIAVIAYYSVTALEAAVLERNVLMVGREGEDYPMPYHEILSVPFLTNENDLRTAMIDVLERGSAASSSILPFKEANPHLFDNSTFRRLAEVIEDVCKNGADRLRTPGETPTHPFVDAPFREYKV